MRAVRYPFITEFSILEDNAEQVMVFFREMILVEATGEIQYGIQFWVRRYSSHQLAWALIRVSLPLHGFIKIAEISNKSHFCGFPILWLFLDEKPSAWPLSWLFPRLQSTCFDKPGYLSFSRWPQMGWYLYWCSNIHWLDIFFLINLYSDWISSLDCVTLFQVLFENIWVLGD